MKTWKRAQRRLVCGAEEGCWILNGSAYLELRIGEMTRTLLRCERHAGEAAHDVQEPAIASAPRAPSTAKALRWLATQAEQKLKRSTIRGDFDAQGEGRQERHMIDLGVPSAACDAVMAARHPSPADGGPCVTCAFRVGTEANTTPHTVILARLCVEGSRPFYCHERPGLCRGFVAALNLRGVIPADDVEAKRWETANAFAADVYAQAIAAGVEADRAAQAFSSPRDAG